MASTRRSIWKGRAATASVSNPPQPLAVEQLAEAAQAQSLVEEGVAPLLELEQHLLDIREAEAKVAAELGRPLVEPRLDGLEGELVVPQHGEALAHEPGRLAEGPARDSERVVELEAEALLLVEGGRDLRLEGRKAAAVEGGVVALFARLQSPPRREGEDLGSRAERLARLLPDEPTTFSTSAGVAAGRPC